MALSASNGSTRVLDPRRVDYDAELDDNSRASASDQGEGSGEEEDGDEVDDEEEAEDDAEDDNEDDDAEDDDSRIVKPLSRKDLESYDAKQRKRGIIYISRIPYGMTVPKVRHLLGGFGEVDRIFLQDGREKEAGPASGASSKRKHKSAHFTEGWVEFTDKRVAKAVASMLNAEPIGAAAGGTGGGKGGKRAGGRALRRWKDEVWTMKYLSGFKWGMLSEQLTNERAARASRVRAQLAQSAHEQKDYLRKVERARIQREKESRRQAKEAKQQSAGGPPVAAARSTDLAREHTFRQREAITRDVREQRAKRALPSSSTDDERAKRPRSSADEHRRQALQGALTKIF